MRHLSSVKRIVHPTFGRSPDLNPVDYRIWGLMQQRLYKTPVRDAIDLKKRLVDTWASIPQYVVDEAVDQWTARLHACVKAKGRQFEHQFSFRATRPTSQPALFKATHILPK